MSQLDVWLVMFKCKCEEYLVFPDCGGRKGKAESTLVVMVMMIMIVMVIMIMMMIMMMMMMIEMIIMMMMMMIKLSSHPFASTANSLNRPLTAPGSILLYNDSSQELKTDNLL